MKCGIFALRGNEKGYEATCAGCWRPFQEARRQAQELRMREEQLKSRVERAQRQERRRRIFGSSSEDSCSPSPTPSEKFMEEQMYMIQAEADMQVAGGRLVRTFFPNLQTNSSLAQGLLKNRTLLESRSFCLGAVCQPYTSKQKKTKKLVLEPSSSLVSENLSSSCPS